MNFARCGKRWILLQETIAGNRRIVILGDYDVDGITATALMLDFLQQMREAWI